MAKMHTISDTFADSSIHTQWDVFGAGTVVESGTLITLTPPASSASGGAGLQSDVSYDLTGSGMAIKCTMPTTTSVFSQIYFDTGSNQDFRFFKTNGDTLLKFRKNVAGVLTDIWSVTYSAVTHAYLFICEQAGTVYGFTSSDGITWTNPAGAGVGSSISSFAITALTPKFTCSNFASNVTPSPLTLDWVNTTGTTPSTPTTPTTSGVAWDRVTLNVTNNANALWWTVERRVTTTGAWRQLGDEIMAPLMPLLDRRFVPSTYLTAYRVTARNGTGASAASAASTEVTPPEYSPPTAVDIYVSPTGLSTGTGSTIGTAVSLSRMFALLGPGKHARLLNGDYNRTNSTYWDLPNLGGAANNHCTISAETLYGVRITIAAATSPADKTGLIVMEGDTHYVDYYGIVFDGANKMNAGVLGKSNHHVRFFFCRAVNVGSGGLVTNNDGTAARADYYVMYRCQGNHGGNYSGSNSGWSSFISLHSHQPVDTYPGLHSWVIRCAASGWYDGSVHHSDGNGFIIDFPTTADGAQNAPYAAFVSCLAYKNGGRGFHGLNASKQLFINGTSYKNALDTACVGTIAGGNNGELIWGGNSPDVAGVQENNAMINMVTQNWESNGRIASDEQNISTLSTDNIWRAVLYATDDVTPVMRLNSSITSDTTKIKRATGDNLGFISTPSVHPTNTGQYATAEAPWSLAANDFKLTTSSQARAQGVDPITTYAGTWPAAVLSDLQLVVYGDYDGNIHVPGSWDLGAFQTDTTTPVLLSLAVINITTTTATITWTTDEPSTSYVNYGLTTGFGSNEPSAGPNLTLVTSHSLTLTGLSPGTLYHFRVRSIDAAGNEMFGGGSPFTTTSGGDVTAPTITVGPDVTVGITTATVTWTTNEASTSHVNYGLTTSYGLDGSVPVDPTLVTSHSVTLTGLAPGTIYHFRVRSSDASANERVSADDTFETNPLLYLNPPGHIIEIAFDTNPDDDSPIWTDVTEWVYEWSYARGREHELDRFETGTATIVLDNSDRRFEPTYAGSPYYPDVVPLRRARIRAVWEGVTYPLFDGYIETYTLDYPNPLEGRVTLALVDGAAVLAALALDMEQPEELSGARIDAVLDDIGWPASERVIATGLNRVAGRRVHDVTALTHLQDVAQAENGYLWVGKDGKVIFRDRASRIRQPITTYLTLGEGGGAEQLYVRVLLDYDTAHLYNEVRITPVQGGTEQVASDATSMAKYYRRSLALFDTEHAEDGTALLGAQVLVGRYKEPMLRAKRLQLAPTATNGSIFWPHALGREIGDRIVLRKRPPGGGTMLNQPSTIERIEQRHVVEDNVWETTWVVSPANPNSYWQLGDSVYGRLNSTTRLWSGGF